MTELVEGALVASKFRLERIIGKGGMGSVWAARHLKLDMPVALKFMDPVADTPDARVRFEREAKAAAALRSPHVVQILDHGLDDGVPYIAMELLEGEDLGERLRREQRLSLSAASKILSQAAKALRRAHDSGIIHRDLKPSNIFLARFDDDEIVKLLDFGVAKLHVPGGGDAGLPTQTGIVFGSPSYMSPEQARGVRVLDHKTDLWSLAVILFRLITGEKPFLGDSIGDLVIKLCIDPLPVATRIAPGLPKPLDAFFDRAFARDPDQRFPSATALAAEFEAIVTGRPVREDPSGSARIAVPASIPRAASAPPVPTPASGSLLAPVSLTPGPAPYVAPMPPRYSSRNEASASTDDDDFATIVSSDILRRQAERTGGHAASGAFSTSGGHVASGAYPTSAGFGAAVPAETTGGREASDSQAGMRADTSPPALGRWSAAEPMNDAGVSAPNAAPFRVAMESRSSPWSRLASRAMSAAQRLRMGDVERRGAVVLAASFFTMIGLVALLVGAFRSGSNDVAAAPALSAEPSPASSFAPAVTEPPPSAATAAPTALAPTVAPIAPEPSSAPTAEPSAKPSDTASSAPTDEARAIPQPQPRSSSVPRPSSSSSKPNTLRKHKPNFGY